jgi:hypothetical protein
VAKKLELTGQKFGRLLVLYEAKKPDGWRCSAWFCQCNCGNQKIIRGATLQNGTSKSCGCLRIKNNLLDKQRRKQKFNRAAAALGFTRQEFQYLKGRFAGQKWEAKRRKIPFLLTWDEWITIWLASGHLFERGPHSNEYVMARFGDKGPYAVGNVKIITAAQNLSEGNKGKIPWQHKRSMRKAVSCV